MMITRKLILYVIVIFHLLWVSQSHANDVRKINPPDLEAKNFGDYELLNQTVRHGKPAMFIEENDNGKVIAHNYGFGGGAWSLAPGASNYIVDELEKYEPAITLQKDTNIAVLGYGVESLFTALSLVERGYKNIIVYAQDENDKPAPASMGGIFGIMFMDNSSEIDPLIEKIGIASYKFYHDIAVKKHRTFKMGASLMPAYFESRNYSGLEFLVGSVIKPAKDVTLDFKNGTKKSVVVYDSAILINSNQLIHTLQASLRKKKVKFQVKLIKDFSQLSEKFIINCNNTIAKNLAQDGQLTSLKEVQLVLKNQNRKNFNYMMYLELGEEKIKNEPPIKRLFYITPQKKVNAKRADIGVLGGIVVTNVEQYVPSKQVLDIIASQAFQVYGKINPY